MAAGVLAVIRISMPLSSRQTKGCGHVQPILASVSAVAAIGPLIDLHAALAWRLPNGWPLMDLCTAPSMRWSRPGLTHSIQALMSVRLVPLLHASSGCVFAFQIIRAIWLAGAISALAVGSPLSSSARARDLFLA